MAKARSPLLSIGASGKFGGTLVAAPWKGIKTVREYALPTNPRTALQQAHRSRVGYAITAWRGPAHVNTFAPAWNLAAATLRKHYTGYHLFVSTATKLQAVRPSAWIIGQMVEAMPPLIYAYVSHLGPTSPPTDPGNFDIMAGTDPANLTLYTSQPKQLTYPWIQFTAPHPHGLWYIAVEKDGFRRSGIYAITTY